MKPAEYPLESTDSEVQVTCRCRETSGRRGYRCREDIKPDTIESLQFLGFSSPPVWRCRGGMLTVSTCRRHFSAGSALGQRQARGSDRDQHQQHQRGQDYPKYQAAPSCGHRSSLALSMSGCHCNRVQESRFASPPEVSTPVVPVYSLGRPCGPRRNRCRC
jgi:hypothetical protein